MSEIEDDLPNCWLEKLIDLDEKLAAGDPFSLDDVPAELAAAGDALRELRRLARSGPPDTPALKVPRSAPRQIGRYLIQGMVGVGGCAMVYRGWDHELNRDVAIKVPLPNQLAKEDSRQRFIREAQAAARLDHPHIVKAYEAGVDGDTPFIVYTFCDGPTLAQWLRSNGPMNPLEVAEMLFSLADAVHYSHSLGVLHRDLKPSNVLLFPSRQPDMKFGYTARLTDFGFARFLEDAASLTCSSVIVGTPIYLAPEQLNACKVAPTVATDVFGLGILMFESLTNSTPCQGDWLVQVLDNIRSGNYATLGSRREIPSDLASIGDKALSFDPADRYESAAELKADLGRFLRGESVLASGPSIARQWRRRLQAPQRIHEGAGFMILSNVAMLLWISAWPIAILFSLPIAGGATNTEILPYTAPLILLHGFFIMLGVRMNRCRVWAAAAGTILSGLLVLFQVAILADWISPPYPTIYPNARTRDIVFSLLLSLFFVQFMLSACAWRAIRVRGRSSFNPPR